jgi:hypothetical protein
VRIGIHECFLCIELLAVASLPHNHPFVSDAPDAVEGDELCLIMPFYLHPALVQADNFVSLDSGPVARSSPVNEFYLGSAKIELRIMQQTQEKGVTGSHFASPLSHSPGSVLQVGMRQPSLIAAHLAAHIHKHTIFAPGLCYVAASGTVVQETGCCHCSIPGSSSVWIYFRFISTIILFIRFDPNPGQLCKPDVSIAGKINSLEATKDF